MSKIVHIDDNNFETEVLASDKMVVVEFGATWCGPCQRQTPILEKFAGEHEDVKVCAIDIDDAPEVASRFGIRSVPTILFFADGGKVGMKVGLTSGREISELVVANRPVKEEKASE